MRGTLLEIRPRALTDNARHARALADGARVFAMVKANGYGHGLGLAARAFANAVDGLGVAVIEEAQALRHLGLAHPVLVAEGFFDADELALPPGCTRKWWCTRPGRWTCWRPGPRRWGSGSRSTPA